MDTKEKAKGLIEDEVLPKANSNLSGNSIEYQVVESKGTMLTGGEVVYIAPVNTSTGEPIFEDNGILADLGLVGGHDQFQEDILEAFREVVGEFDADDVFNVTAGHTYAKVKVDPLLGGNI